MLGSILGLFYLVPVKCRQNVANKLFISHYFNPVVPIHLYNKLTALTAKCLLNALMNAKEVEASSFSLWRYRTTYTTVVVDVGPFGSVGFVAQVPSMACLS